MRKAAFVLCVIGLFSFAAPLSVLAKPFGAVQDSQRGVGVAVKATGLDAKKCKGQACVIDVVSIIVTVLFSVIGLVLLGFIFYAGVLWMTAGGSIDQVKQARHTMINVAVGLVVIIGSYAAAQFAIKQLWYATTEFDTSHEDAVIDAYREARDNKNGPLPCSPSEPGGPPIDPVTCEPLMP